MGLLDGLDDVDWSAIKHSHSTSELFPYYLRQLAQNDSKSWDSAIEYIREYSNHQATIYDVTPHVAPFLIDLLQTLPVSRTPDLLDILAGYAWTLENVHNQIWIERSQQNVIKGFMSQTESSAWVKAVEETRAILEANLEIFLPYLDHEDPQVRAPAAELLYQFTKFQKIDEAIQRRREIETDEYVKRVLQYGLQS